LFVHAILILTFDFNHSSATAKDWLAMLSSLLLTHKNLEPDPFVAMDGAGVDILNKF
jgi:hypothetical protein